MKINDTQASAPDPDVDSSDVDSTRDDQKQQEERSAFSRVLAKKQDSHQEISTLKGGKTDVGPETSRLGMASTPQAFEQIIQTKKIETKHVVELPAQLQQLVREISVVAGTNQVQIEMNSNVLKGLSIRIERQSGGLAIQFQSSSPEVSKLLSNNLDSLQQGLADRGLNVADVRITDSKGSSNTQASQSRPGASQPRFQRGRR